MAGRLAAEAQALWQMQNSTVQSQEALVVSACWVGGSWCCWCLPSGVHVNGVMELWNPSHLPVPQEKLGESVQFLSRLAPRLQVLVWFLPAWKCPMGPKNPVPGDGRARENTISFGA